MKLLTLNIETKTDIIVYKIIIIISKTNSITKIWYHEYEKRTIKKITDSVKISKSISRLQ